MLRGDAANASCVAGVRRPLVAVTISSAALSSHCRALIDHLDDEESHVLPLAGRHLTSLEWAALGEHFVATTPKAQLLIFLGAVLEDATLDERTALISVMPHWGRAVWSIGRRRYGSYVRRVRGVKTYAGPTAVCQDRHGGLTMSFSGRQKSHSCRPRRSVASRLSSPRNAPSQSRWLYLQRRNPHLRHPRLPSLRESEVSQHRKVGILPVALVVDDVPSLDPWACPLPRNPRPRRGHQHGCRDA